MGAGAPYGNKNAEKWKIRKAICLYQDAIELSNKTQLYKVQGQEIEGYTYDFIGEIARKLGTYHNLITIHLPDKFPALKRLKNQLLNNLESNCFYNGKRGIIKEASSIMNLKSNHKWTDRTENISNTTITWHEEKTYEVDEETNKGN